MKLRKINDIHFVITDGSPTTNGDYAIHSITLNVSQHHSKDNSLSEGWEKIEFSTQPIGKPMLFTNAFESDIGITFNGLQDTVIENWGCKKLSLQKVKELIGEVDVEKKALAFAEAESYGKLNGDLWKGFLFGYNQALADNKGKKYTEEDVISIVKKSRETGLTAEYLMLTLQPKTEWEVEIVDGKLKLV